MSAKIEITIIVNLDLGLASIGTVREVYETTQTSVGAAIGDKRSLSGISAYKPAVTSARSVYASSVGDKRGVGSRRALPEQESAPRSIRYCRSFCSDHGIAAVRSAKEIHGGVISGCAGCGLHQKGCAPRGRAIEKSNLSVEGID